jgi:predicted RND superfamily exporter protein
MASKLLPRVADFTAKRFGAIIGIVIVITILFTSAIITIQPIFSSGAMNSEGEIHDAFIRYEDNFRPSIHGIPFILEAKDGNILGMEELRDIQGALDKLEDDEIIEPMIIEFFDSSLLMNMTLTNTITPAIKAIMDGESPIGYQMGYHAPPNYGNNFSEATDDDLNTVLDHLFQYQDSSGTSIYRELVSAELKQENGVWTTPIVMIFMGVNNDILEQNYTYREGGEEGKEYFEALDLHALEILKDNIDTCHVNGLGLGINTEIEKEIEESGPFIMFTFIVIIIILAVTFRHNLKSFLAAATGLPLIVIWMMGSAKLLNLSETTFNAFLPILIMALGVDYAIHSMKRFDEELLKGKSPRESVRGSITMLNGTLALAMVTTCVAFFSNFLSPIPALRDWGLEAGLAIIWTFVIMGFFVPSLRLAFERGKNRDKPYYTNIKSEKNDKEQKNLQQKRKAQREKIAKNRVGNGLTKLTFSSMSRPAMIILILVILIVPLGYGAVNLGSNFEVKEFFNSESDLVVGLDKYTEHFPTGGEPNILLIEGEIADPDVIEAIELSKKRFEARGYATWYNWDISQIVRNFTENLMINNFIGGNSIVITDTDNNNIPDEKSQITSILKQISSVGLFAVINGNITMIFRPDLAREIIHYDEKKDAFDKTNMQVGVSGSGSLVVIKEGMDNIEKDSKIIEETGKAEVIITGTAPLRYEQLTAISNSMLYSVIISIIICFIILMIIFRKVAFAFVAILPVILIAVWLYGIMFYTGFNLNIVTATIGAMSIGVGVDYSIHVCDRFRKERAVGKPFNDSMHETISNTGAALLFAALTTSFGFFVMLFAPMPMFLSFGLFSGLMVIIAFTGSVIVVPPLIRMIEKKK